MERDRIRAGVAAVVLGEEGHFPVSIDTSEGNLSPTVCRALCWALACFIWVSSRTSLMVPACPSYG